MQKQPLTLPDEVSFQTTFHQVREYYSMQQQFRVGAMTRSRNYYIIHYYITLSQTTVKKSTEKILFYLVAQYSRGRIVKCDTIVIGHNYCLCSSRTNIQIVIV